MTHLGAVSLTLFLVFVKQLWCVCSCLSSNLGSFWLLRLQMYFLFFSLFFSSSGTPIIHRLVHLLFSYKYFRLFIFFILFSFCSPDWIISIMCLKSFLILSSSHSHLLFTSLMNFSFQLYFSTPDFLFSFLKNNICLFIDILYLIRYHFHCLGFLRDKL